MHPDQTLPTDDYNLTTGDTIGFSYTDENGDTVTVNSATVQQTAFADGGNPNMSGVLTAQGEDQNGDQVALVLNMNATTPFNAGSSYYDNDADVHNPATNATDIALDPAVNMLYIGNFADVDPVESDNDNENASILNGVTASNNTVLEVVSIQPHDNVGTQNLIQDNDTAQPVGDVSNYIRPSTGMETIIATDSSASHSATILLGDGTTTTLNVLVVQMTNGDVFVSDLLNNGTLDNMNIQSITLGSVVSSAASGWYDNQSVDGTNIVCFTTGTEIRTPTGAVPVENLSKGDLVWTVDHGYQPIRWIGSMPVSNHALQKNKKLRPIHISAGALGNGQPAKDLRVSPQHRMFVHSKIARRLFGNDELLIAAKHLTELPGIHAVEDVQSVEYFHFLFDAHELVIANGAVSESLYTGPQALNSVAPEAKIEILSLFPELLDKDYNTNPCRTLATGRMGRQLAAKHHMKHRALAPEPNAFMH